MNATNTPIASKLDPRAVWPMPGETATHRVTVETETGARLLADGCFDEAGVFTGSLVPKQAPTLPPAAAAPAEAPAPLTGGAALLEAWGFPAKQQPAKAVGVIGRGDFYATADTLRALMPADVAERLIASAVEVPPLARNEMGPANAEEPVTAEEVASDDLDAELKAIEESLKAGQAGEPVALIAEAPEAVHEGEWLEVLEEGEMLEVLDAAAEPELEDESAPAVKKRVHIRPTVDRLFADFTRAGRLDAVQLSAMRARCATLGGFRAAVHEFVAASVLRRPAFAHLYRYPHPKTLEQMHREWLRMNSPRVADIAGLSVYDELSAVASKVPL